MKEGRFVNTTCLFCVKISPFVQPGSCVDPIRRPALVADNLRKIIPAESFDVYRDADKPKPLMMSSFLEVYLEKKDWERIATRDTARTYIQRFIDVMGDLDVSTINKQHAYQYAEAVEHKYANKSIKSQKSAVSAFLSWLEQRGKIEANPFVDVKLTGYGQKAKSRRPFSEDELKSLFAQSMTKQERLIFSLLITTGMRLDEVCLLEWSQVKEKGGIRYLDLSDSHLVKNEGSKRLVPLHDCIQLNGKGSGPMFDYTRDNDGKASTAASKKLMPIVNRVTKDKLNSP